jgi:hypothetical protein
MPGSGNCFFDCGCGGGSPIDGDHDPMPDCFCTSYPSTLTMKSCDHVADFGLYQDATIQYQPTPPGLAALSLGSHLWLSNETFTDVIAGADFRYLLTCHSNQSSLSLVYETSPYGSPFRSGLLYSWTFGGIGDNCSPFYLTGGVAPPASAATTCVAIYGSSTPPGPCLRADLGTTPC